MEDKFLLDSSKSQAYMLSVSPERKPYSNHSCNDCVQSADFFHRVFKNPFLYYKRNKRDENKNSYTVIQYSDDLEYWGVLFHPFRLIVQWYRLHTLGHRPYNYRNLSQFGSFSRFLLIFDVLPSHPPVLSTQAW